MTVMCYTMRCDALKAFAAADRADSSHFWLRSRLTAVLTSEAPLWFNVFSCAADYQRDGAHRAVFRSFCCQGVGKLKKNDVCLLSCVVMVNE